MELNAKIPDGPIAEKWDNLDGQPGKNYEFELAASQGH